MKTFTAYANSLIHLPGLEVHPTADIAESRRKRRGTVLPVEITLEASMRFVTLHKIENPTKDGPTIARIYSESFEDAYAADGLIMVHQDLPGGLHSRLELAEVSVFHHDTFATSGVQNIRPRPETDLRTVMLNVAVHGRYVADDFNVTGGIAPGKQVRIDARNCSRWSTEFAPGAIHALQSAGAGGLVLFGAMPGMAGALQRAADKVGFPMEVAG